MCYVYVYTRGDPRNRTYLLESWPLSTGFPLWVSILGTHLHQRTSCRCCERLRSASVNIFWRLFQSVCPFHGGWFSSVPAHTSLSVQQFLIQNSMAPVPHPPFSSSLALSNFFFVSLMKKVLKGKHFAYVEKVKQKIAEDTKRHQNWRIQKLV